MHIQFSPALRAEITLPTSKSISARALIINALSAQPCAVEGVSDCDDTRAVVAALRDNPEVVDIGAAGTAMRFLTAFFATREGETHLLTGSERMQQRPIGILVDALRSLGADISYARNEGYPPLLIRGRRLRGGTLPIAASTSSQYLSALLMIAPTLSEGLTLQLQGEVASAPYLRMTLALMRAFGVESQWAEGEIRVPNAAYHRAAPYAVEPDWSAASYWYELLALCPDADGQVLLRGLSLQSVQGDSACAQLFAPLGIATETVADGLLLRRTAFAPQRLDFDFADCPDLAQTLVAAAAMRGCSFRFAGLKTLKIKETDRIAALCTELAKYGVRLVDQGEGRLAYDASDAVTSALPTVEATIDTYDDHRMAMAFAPTAHIVCSLRINHPEVVSKSYPEFWEDLKGVGMVAD
ncbi:MAG: 3-phosphoshikimate 1-carboxyvinyltransferase [Bacteroidaceae bacterium]|nr:3-phosphoshikimate 1-carboxyvinyltransferase [Bacteroidaceae bacterium]